MLKEGTIEVGIILIVHVLNIQIIDTTLKKEKGMVVFVIEDEKVDLENKVLV